jgi:hypothetical protein
MSCKNRGQINYFKFMEMATNIVDENDSRHVLEEAYKIFKPKNINRFAAALERPGKRMRYVLDLDFKTAGRFIDADTFTQDKDHLELFKVLLIPKRRHFFWRHKIQDISIHEGQIIMESWMKFLADIKDQYEYIYNPPVRAGGSMNTQGSMERQAFLDFYGAYMEMVYILTGGHLIDSEKVFGWDIHRFLFQAEYLLRKRDVENIK